MFTRERYKRQSRSKRYSLWNMILLRHTDSRGKVYHQLFMFVALPSVTEIAKPIETHDKAVFFGRLQRSLLAAGGTTTPLCFRRAVPKHHCSQCSASCHTLLHARAVPCRPVYWTPPVSAGVWSQAGATVPDGRVNFVIFEIWVNVT